LDAHLFRGNGQIPPFGIRQRHPTGNLRSQDFVLQQKKMLDEEKILLVDETRHIGQNKAEIVRIQGTFPKKVRPIPPKSRCVKAITNLKITTNYKADYFW
jgi:hypothetical protein